MYTNGAIKLLLAFSALRYAEIPSKLQYLYTFASLLCMQRCRIALLYCLSEQVQQVRSRARRLPNGLVIVYWYCADILAVVESSKGDPDTSPMASDRIQPVTYAQFVHKSCGIDAHPNSCPYLFVLRCLFIYVDLDGYAGGRAMMVDG